MSELTLTVERTIKAPQEDVFAAWLDPEKLGRFMQPAPGMGVGRASTDPRIGGRFDIVMIAGENELPHSGTYREITPYRRLVFTWEGPYSAEDSLVTLEFAPAEGGTHVTLTHVRFMDEELRDRHRGGWTNIFDALDRVLGEATEEN